MSSRLALCAALVLPAAVMAQDVAMLRQHLDVFRQATGVAQARLRAFDDSVRRQRDAYQRVEVGAFRVITEPALATTVETGARDASDSLAWLGTSRDRVRERTIVVRRLETGVAHLEASLLAPDGIEYSLVSGMKGETGARDVALLLTTVAHNVLATDLHALHRGWLPTRPSFDTVSTREWTRIRLDLVSSRATVGPRCYRGEIAACSAVLGLTPTADPIVEWYDAEGRRQLVTGGGRRSLRGLAARCDSGDDDACITALRAMSGDPSHLTRHRGSLLQLALQMGGARAPERLFAPAATPAARIAVVAGVPADSVVRVWQGRVHDARLPSDDLTPSIAAMSLLWIGVFGALALRSPRWR